MAGSAELIDAALSRAPRAAPFLLKPKKFKP